MAELQGQVKRHSQARDVTLLKKYELIEVNVANDGDTLNIDSMVTVESVKVINLADAVDVAVTVLGKVVTIDDVGAVNAHLLFVAVGV